MPGTRMIAETFPRQPGIPKSDSLFPTWILWSGVATIKAYPIHRVHETGKTVIVATFIPRFVVSREYRSYFSALGWLPPWDALWQLKFGTGEYHLRRTRRCDHCGIFFVALCNVCTDLLTYELITTLLEWLCAFFNDVRTASGRRISTTAVLIWAFLLWFHGPPKMVMDDVVVGMSSYTELGRLSLLLYRYLTSAVGALKGSRGG